MEEILFTAVIKMCEQGKYFKWVLAMTSQLIKVYFPRTDRHCVTQVARRLLLHFSYEYLMISSIFYRTPLCTRMRHGTNTCFAYVNPNNMVNALVMPLCEKEQKKTLNSFLGHKMSRWVGLFAIYISNLYITTGKEYRSHRSINACKSH